MQHIKAITNIPGWLEQLQLSGIPKTSDALYSRVPLIYRCIRLRADSLSAVPVKIMQGKDKEVEWPYPEPLETLIWRAEASLLMTGGGYWEIVKNQYGYKKTLKFRNPFGMTVSYADGKITFKQGRMSWVNDFTTGDYQMVYFADYDPAQDVLPGVGDLEAASIDGQLLAALSKFPQTYFEGGAMPVTLLGIDSTDPGEIKRVENWFKNSATAIKNAFRVLGIRAGAIVPTKMTPDLDTLTMPELGAQARKNIYTAFGIPESMLDTTSSNFATAKEARIGFYEDIVKPRAKLMENVINTQLLAKDKMTIKFDFESMAIFQEDESDRATRVRDLRAANVPLRLAFDLAGYELTDEQLAWLDEPMPEERPATPVMADAMGEELRRWQRMAEKRIRTGKPVRDFDSDIIPPALNGAIAGQLDGVKSIEDVRAVFKTAIMWQAYP